MAEIDEIVNEFLVESYENLDQLDRDFVILEKEPGRRDILASIFRTIHTIKGTCGFLGFSKLESLTHVGENLLSKLRDGHIALRPEITSALLAMIDAVRQMLAAIESSQNEGSVDYSDLKQRLVALTQVGEGASAGAPVPAAVASATPAAPSKGSVSGAAEQTASPPNLPSAAASAQASQSAPSAASTAVPGAAEASKAAAGNNAIAESTIRVHVDLLDRLMNLVGELVLSRNQILQRSGAREDNGFNAAAQRLNLITSELQEGVMKTRMQPIGNVWGKFPRVVRDLALQCQKQARIEMEGKETELDKTIIEAIKDPLTHIVRNSVDHGIERPEARIAAGKSAEGVIVLRAFHEGGQVNIEIKDDGGGIDPDKLRRKAVERGVVTAEQASKLQDRDAIALIFAPGFSTAEKVTNVSGRGVGMDVVKTNIEKIGGQVDVASLLGQGTTIRIKIPLTLAIIPALIVSSGGTRIAIPQVSLTELVRIDGEQAGKAIETIQGSPVYRLRGQLLPLVNLNKLLGIESNETCDAVNIVVLQSDEQQFGLIVDRINDTQEIVVKPLSKLLKSTSLFAGATIMGDGRVSLILDVTGVAKRSHVIGKHSDRAAGLQSVASHADKGTKLTLLVFGIGDTGRMAIPLSQVARLEEFERHRIEVAGQHKVVQYRGQIMPLVSLSEYYGASSRAAEADPLPVVVHTQAGRSVGLIVDRILDIVEERVAVQAGAGRHGFVGTAVVQDRVTELVDVDAVVGSVVDAFYGVAQLESVGA